MLDDSGQMDTAEEGSAGVCRKQGEVALTEWDDILSSESGQ